MRFSFFNVDILGTILDIVLVYIYWDDMQGNIGSLFVKWMRHKRLFKPFVEGIGLL